MLSSLLRRSTNFAGRCFQRLGLPVYLRDGMATIHDHSFLSDPRFQSAYQRGLKATDGQDYQIPWRLSVALWCARQAMTGPGDFIECGVNRGFVSSAIMHDLNWNQQQRRFFLVDTFGGIDEAQLTPAERAAGLQKYNERSKKSGFYVLDVQSVRRNFSEWERAIVVQGIVPQCLQPLPLEQVRFVHLDLNSVVPEIEALEYLWPLLTPGGVVLADDYAFFGFASHKKPYDDFAAKKGVQILSMPTGQGILIKPSS